MALRMSHHLRSTMASLRFEEAAVRVRGSLGGTPVLDSRAALLVWEPRRVVPVYAVPVTDLLARVTPAFPQPPAPDLGTVPPVLGPTDFWRHTCPGTVLDLTVGARTLPGAGFVPEDPDLADHVLVDFASLEEWRAEDELLVGHPRDPFKRIDVLATAQHVEIRLDGVVLASSSRARMLCETHLPQRFYLPEEDVRMDLLTPSPTRSTCAYKGVASYLSTSDGTPQGRDVAWRYPDPLDDAIRVRDRVCFWSERVDLVLDGDPVPRPVSPWSGGPE